MAVIFFIFSHFNGIAENVKNKSTEQVFRKKSTNKSINIALDYKLNDLASIDFLRLLSHYTQCACMNGISYIADNVCVCIRFPT